MTTNEDGTPVKLPSTDRAGGMVEPHVAIDPADPRRAAVVATYPSDRNPRGIGRSIWCWVTADGGRI